MALSKIDVANMLTGLVPNDNTIRRKNAKPIIINGNMAVAQRATSATGKTGTGYYTCDRINCEINSIGTYTITQESLTSGNAFNNGFANAWRIDTTTADASPSANDYLFLNTILEGQDLQLFKKGTSNAQKFTLAFWVKSNKTGTGNVNFRDRDNARFIGGTYTISSADTWEHKVVNFAADTTGAFADDNGGSLEIEWWLDGGSNFNTGATPTAWEAFSHADRNPSGTLDIADNTANDWAITGIQLEVGEFSSTTLPPFQHESFGDNLSRCQRYFNILMNSGTERTDSINAHIHDNDTMRGSIHFPVEMRSTPSVTSSSSGSADHWRYISNGINTNYGSAITMSASSKSAQFTLVDTGGTNVQSNVNEPGQIFNNTTSCFLKIDAEL